MTFTVMHRMGDHEHDPDAASLPDLIAELDGDDAEHPDVAIRTPDGWTMSAMQGGDVYWENIEDDADDAVVRYMRALPRDRALELFRAVARGDLGEVEAQPWQRKE
jgi:hypothetical protein